MMPMMVMSSLRDSWPAASGSGAAGVVSRLSGGGVQPLIDQGLGVLQREAGPAQLVGADHLTAAEYEPELPVVPAAGIARPGLTQRGTLPESGPAGVHHAVVQQPLFRRLSREQFLNVHPAIVHPRAHPGNTPSSHPRSAGSAGPGMAPRSCRARAASTQCPVARSSQVASWSPPQAPPVT